MREFKRGLFREYPGDTHWDVPLLLNNDRVARDVFNSILAVSGKKPFDNIYGGFKSPWTGGRGSVVTDVLDKGYIPSVRWFSDRGVTSWLTFSRHNVSEERLNDERMWKVLESVRGLNWGAIVEDDNLMARLKEFDPNVKIKASVIKFTREVMGKGDYDLEKEAKLYLDTLAKGYDYVVPRPEFILADGWEAIPENLRDRIEILVNQVCVANCPMAIYHYDLIETFEDTGEWPFFKCSQRKSLIDCLNSCNIDYFTVRELVEQGYNRFKIQGRGMSARCAMSQLSEYIFEPSGFMHILSEQIDNNIRNDLAEGKEARF